MTYHDNTIPAEAALSDDTLFVYPGANVPRRGFQWMSRHDRMRADPRRRMALVLALEDGREMSGPMRDICDFLGISVERIDSNEEFLPILDRCQPMAMVAAMDAEGQDGCNVLMTVARHDPSLPVLLITGANPAAAGAADAVTELWGLTEVVQTPTWPAPGMLAEFLCRAGLRGNCLTFMPA